MTVELTRGKAYVVDRGTRKTRAGQGLLAGLEVVFRHFTSALSRRLEEPDQTSGVFTVQYPEERLPLPEAFRNFPILLYDDETGHELCTSCFQCERICPPQVIHMTQAKDPATGKPVPAVAEFLIEYDACMSCGLCAEVCPFDAIKMDHEFELSTDVHGGLTFNRERLLRPVSYYQSIAPTFWAEVKDAAYKKLQGNMKRRPGTIGIAPQMVERVKAARAADETAAPAAPGDDKQARLAAIRAANAAKAQQGPQAAPAAPGDDKQARLAAIRAANAANKAGQSDGDTPARAQESGTGDAASDGTPTAPGHTAQASDPGTRMPDDKKARLEAIRAANAKRKNTENGDA